MRRQRLAIVVLLVMSGLPGLAFPEGAVSLAEVYQRALERNFGLQSQQYTYNAEKEGVREAWAAALPQLEATASYGTSEYTRDFDLQSSITDRDQHTRYDVSLNQVIYSGKTFREIERAKAGAALAAEELVGRELEIGYAAIEAFLRAQMLRAETSIVESELASHQKRLDQVESMRSRGFATKADTLDAQARIDEVKAELAGLEHDYLVAIKNLEAVSGIEMDNRSLVGVPASIWRRTPTLLSQDWLNMAAENAAQLLRAQGELGLAKAARKAESAAHWPELYLSARYTENDTFATNLRQETRVELQLRVPLYKGGGTSSRVRQATERMYAAEYAVKDTLNQVQVEIARITEELKGSYSRIGALQAAENSARAALEAAEQGFLGGVRSLNDLLDSRNRLAKIRREVTRETFNNVVLQYELRQVAGTLSATDVVAVGS